MSGTSLDGVDLAIIETDGRDYVKFKDAVTINYSDDMRNKLRILISGNYQNIWAVERDLSYMHLKNIKDFIHDNKIDLIGYHGQTIYHNASEGISVQIGNPHILTSQLNVTTVYDFRRNDVANHGQGAPLVPIFLKAVKPKNLNNVCYLNLGGVANVCYVNDEELIAFDVGPCNAPLNDICNEAYNRECDFGGTIASKGNVEFNLLNQWVEDDFFKLSYPKSLDRDHFKFLKFNYSSAQDRMASIVEFIAYAIKKAIESLPSQPSELIISGGGVNNKYLIQRISSLIKIKVICSDAYDLPSSYLEAYAFGYLAVRRRLNLATTFASTTGVQKPSLAGVIIECN